MHGMVFAMKRRHKIFLVLSALLVTLFIVGESERGQEILRGKAKPNETHFETDDRFFGAGLAPMIYCLVPGVLLFVYTIGDMLFCRVRRDVSR